jgi:type IV pilus assembly protein PilN
MKIAINLASQPFRRDRAMVVASSLVAVLLVATLGVLINLALEDNKQLADVRHEVAALKEQVRKASDQQAQLNTVIRKPENETVLERSVFINTLLLRKGISWDQIFTDLEKTIPYNVKLVRIRPTVDDQGRVTLDMILAAESNGPAVGALKAFQENPLFGAVEFADGTPVPPGAECDLCPETLSSRWRPRFFARVCPSEIRASPCGR